jgi:HAD superfamily hydrolase (TIGR01509 family)
MELHYLCNRIALGEVGVPMDKKQYFHQAGMTGHEQIRSFCKRAGKDVTDEDVEKIYQRKRELYKDYINKAKKIECNIELMRMLKSDGVPVAIATGCSRPSIIPVIERFGIKVDALITSEDVKRGKPNPDLFLLAAERLGAEPENCIVIEDSDVGIEAAMRAGMKALRFYDNNKE